MSKDDHERRPEDADDAEGTGEQDIVCTDEVALTRRERDRGEVPGSGMNVGAGIAGVMPVEQRRASRKEGESDPDPEPRCGG